MKKDRLETLLASIGATSDEYAAFERLLIDTRSRCAPIYFPAWISSEEFVNCTGCQDVLARGTAQRKSTKLRLYFACGECHVWWRATRRKPHEQWDWRQRELRWTTPANPLKRIYDLKVTPALVAKHLSWDTGKDFKILSVRARDSQFLHFDQQVGFSAFVAIDLDFKKLWSPDEATRFALRVQEDLATVRAEEILDDYEKSYGKFRTLVREIMDVLPGEPLVFRSSFSHGIHLYWFLDREYLSREITARVRGLL